MLTVLQAGLWGLGHVFVFLLSPHAFRIMAKRFKILVVPSSDDQEAYEDITLFDDAFRTHRRRKDHSKVFAFASGAERAAFAKGVEAMAGYMGEGILFQNVVRVKHKSPLGQPVRTYGRAMGLGGSGKVSTR